LTKHDQLTMTVKCHTCKYITMNVKECGKVGC